MKTVDQATLLHWLDLDVDGQLEGAEKRRLDELLAGDDALTKERRQLEILHEALGESRIEVRPDLQDSVMASLETAAWESPSWHAAGVKAWRLPLAMMLIFALGAAWSLVGVAAENPVVATGVAVLDFMQTTALAGTGVVVASWRGAGFGLEELMASSTFNMAAMAVMVLCLNLLFVSLLRRRNQVGDELATELAAAGRSTRGRHSADELEGPTEG